VPQIRFILANMMTEAFALYNNGFVSVPCDIIDADLASRCGLHVEFYKNGRIVKELELQPKQVLRIIPERPTWPRQ
jgi:hypothetical protein